MMLNERAYALTLLAVLGAIVGGLLLIGDRLQAIADALVRP